MKNGIAKFECSACMYCNCEFISKSQGEILEPRICPHNMHEDISEWILIEFKRY